MLLTEDGFGIARTPANRRSAAHDDDRLASMASSMQALSEAVARELALGTTALSLIEAEEGRVLFRRTAGARHRAPAVLRDDETIGRGMALTARLAKTFGVALRAVGAGDAAASAPDSPRGGASRI